MSDSFEIDIVNRVQFNEEGLVPAVVQDSRTREVLTVAYMNAESLQRTLDRGETWFWSRSRDRLWHKGETSGNFQRVKNVRLDCDSDALLVEVEPQGPACHTGAYSCFGVEPRAGQESATELGALLQRLYRMVQQRQKDRPEGSYTARLFDKGLDKIVQKVGEEAVEVVIAAKNDQPARLIEEVSDLLYHLTVMLVEKGITLENIQEELSSRWKLSAGGSA